MVQLLLDNGASVNAIVEGVRSLERGKYRRVLHTVIPIIDRSPMQSLIEWLGGTIQADLFKSAHWISARSDGTANLPWLLLEDGGEASASISPRETALEKTGGLRRRNYMNILLDCEANTNIFESREVNMLIFAMLKFWNHTSQLQLEHTANTDASNRESYNFFGLHPEGLVLDIIWDRKDSDWITDSDKITICMTHRAFTSAGQEEADFQEYRSRRCCQLLRIIVHAEDDRHMPSSEKDLWLLQGDGERHDSVRDKVKERVLVKNFTG